MYYIAQNLKRVCAAFIDSVYTKLQECASSNGSFVTGPAFWGLINPEWSLCNKGRRQSPVNLEPEKLLFDPNLRFLHIDKHRVLYNFYPFIIC